MRTIRKIEQSVPNLRPRKKVAAYARVSMESERMHHSLSAQISYYSSLIQKNPEWEYAGVYADYGISGTGIKKRQEFRRMLEDAKAGKIDIILTKSIQRFARNTVDLLRTVRHLKKLGVEVWFEKENIHTMSGDGELMLTILASFAQKESRSISTNVKWGTRKRFAKGIPNGRFRIYGYRWKGDQLVIEPKEAAVIKLIYDNFLNGLSAEATEKQLAERGVKSSNGKHFSNTSIRAILKNITYTGNLLFQKEYVTDPITGKTKINRGELPQYFVGNTHEAIIPMEVYQKVQAEQERRRKLGALANWSINTCLDGGKERYWRCAGKCGNGSIKDSTMKNLTASVLGMAFFDEGRMDELLEKAVIQNGEVVFYFKDGHTETRQYKEKIHRCRHSAAYRRYMHDLMKLARSKNPEAKVKIMELKKEWRRDDNRWKE